MNKCSAFRAQELDRQTMRYFSPEIVKETTMLKYVLPFALAMGVAAPAFAADYYIVRGPDKKCKIVEKRPTEKTVTVIGHKAYVTREEADKQMAVVCKTR
jgi:hypothetical protein